MDARITKQRLANLISYDWIKILCTILAAILVLVLLFTMAATRPHSTQQYYVYTYTDLSAGADFTDLADDLKAKHVFSYDILEVSAENFDSSSSGSTVYTVRRSAGMGNVLFVTDNPAYETDEDGNTVLDEEGKPVVAAQSTLYTMASSGLVANDASTAGVAYDTVYYMDACERYLKQFFGDDWRTSDAFDGTLTPEACFTARNDGDKRYRTDEARAQGVADEKARLLQLREDYLVVDAAFESGVFTHTAYENELGETDYPGINVGGLNTLHDLVYYVDGETRSTENVNLILLFNGPLAQNDLRFESISFLNYLLTQYQN